jgi:hypothetical protein
MKTILNTKSMDDLCPIDTTNGKTKGKTADEIFTMLGWATFNTAHHYYTQVKAKIGHFLGPKGLWTGKGEGKGLRWKK